MTSSIMEQKLQFFGGYLYWYTVLDAAYLKKDYSSLSSLNKKKKKDVEEKTVQAHLQNRRGHSSNQNSEMQHRHDSQSCEMVE